MKDTLFLMTIGLLGILALVASAQPVKKQSCTWQHQRFENDDRIEDTTRLLNSLYAEQANAAKVMIIAGCDGNCVRGYDVWVCVP